ncbi:LysE family translocator [Bacillus mangrovi]|uniref:LysE family translocator n=1 Tax=Metabacillus mangrovi TaxID=1491830 RepID=A0A7X2S5I1_9BACI|nr:LysE family transporter [Metabacillus mangrovi]MTH53648.1 LysE family translocator [Metabacillus mangrovi]
MILLKAMILGFSVSAPVGPIGILCIQRTLARGRAAGWFTGLGAVTANLIYAGAAAYGFSAAAGFLLQYELYLKLFGTGFLLYLGVKTYRKKPAAEAAKLQGDTLVRMYTSTFLLMISNPSTILNFAAMFSGLGFGGGPETATVLVIGVFTGALLWWTLLSFGVHALRRRVNPLLPFINKAAGILICVLGALSFFS